MSEIYLPAEDSLFLSEFVKKEIKSGKPRKILDMGSGSGIQSESAIMEGVNPGSLTLVDINNEAIKHLRKKFPGLKIIYSNLFQNVGGKFDLIIFNPPYLPKNKYDNKEDTTGGENGSEVINEFLKQSKSYLTKNGEILLLTSSFTKSINWQNYQKKLLGKKNLFFEELYVWKLINYT